MTFNRHRRNQLRHAHEAGAGEYGELPAKGEGEVKLYIAETLEGDWVIGVFSSVDQAIAECKQNATHYQRDTPEFKKEYNGGEYYEWLGYDPAGRMTYYISERTLNNEVD